MCPVSYHADGLMRFVSSVGAVICLGILYKVNQITLCYDMCVANWRLCHTTHWVSSYHMWLFAAIYIILNVWSMSSLGYHVPWQCYPLKHFFLINRCNMNETAWDMTTFIFSLRVVKLYHSDTLYYTTKWTMAPHMYPMVNVLITVSSFPSFTCLNIYVHKLDVASILVLRPGSWLQLWLHKKVLVFIFPHPHIIYCEMQEFIES